MIMAVQMNTSVLSKTIKEKARSLGASLVGVTSVSSVLKTPSHQEVSDAHRRFKGGSFIVMALEHPASNPSLDWWDGEGGTPGNSELRRISTLLRNWLKETLNITSQNLPYHVENGGIFLKEAAVVAGLGVIGRNNLLITPQYGSSVRLRAMFLDRDVPSDIPARFAPCDTCSAPCRAACPQNAFENGKYQQMLCNIQMKKDDANQQSITMGNCAKSVIQYCRACEWACPVSQGVFKIKN
jgi:epoxyqueuosine reductase